MSPTAPAPAARATTARDLGVVMAAVAAIAAIGWIDVITGPDIGMSMLYLLPVFVTAWYVGARGGLATAVLASSVWFCADLMTQDVTSVALSSWNGATRLFIFSALSVLLARVRGDQRALQRLLARETALALTDAVTGLANSRAFLREVKTEIARATRDGHPLCLMYLDVDNFKRINDKFGHAAGDAALVAIADAIQSTLRGTDVVARLGGDEFAVLLWNVERSQLQELAERVVQRVTELDAQFPGCTLGMSAGVVHFATPPASAEVAIARADKLMYEVKRAGKGRVLLETIEADVADVADVV